MHGSDMDCCLIATLVGVSINVYCTHNAIAGESHENHAWAAGFGNTVH